MTKMFGNLTSTENLEASEDRLGGGYEAMPTDAYLGSVKLVYVLKSRSSNAMGVSVTVDVNGREVREDIWGVTTKNGENFYTDKDDPSKRLPLPGFTLVDDLCLLTTGLGLIDQDTEEKIVKIWSSAEKKEVPTPVQCLTALHGKEIGIGLLRSIVDKEKKNDAGEYEPTGETRTVNEIDKFFHAETGRTVNEYRNEVTTSEFRDAWVKKNQGKDRNKVKGSSAGGAGASGSGMPGGSATPKKSLFGGS